jgi:N-ethylmaleimide reductase
MAIVKSGDAGLLAFGRYFTSNPDLPHRLKYNLLLGARAL